MFRIAITGKANTGKNTLATLLDQIIFDNHMLTKLQEPYSGRFMAFADPIKQIVLTMFPQAKKECLFGPSALRAEAIPDAFKEGQPLTYRQALIDIGTLARTYNDLVLIQNFQDRYEKVLLLKQPPQIVVVTDVRFRNEFDHLKDQGFYQIRLYRDTNAPETATSKHESETQQATIADDEFDCVLNNNRTLDYLTDEVKKIIPKLKS